MEGAQDCGQSNNKDLLYLSSLASLENLDPLLD